jgi:hypothetical protein
MPHMQAISTHMRQLRSLTICNVTLEDNDGWADMREDTLPHLCDVLLVPYADGSRDSLDIPISLSFWAALRRLPSLRSLRIGTCVDPDDINLIAALTQLQALSIGSCNPRRTGCDLKLEDEFVPYNDEYEDDMAAGGHVNQSTSALQQARSCPAPAQGSQTSAAAQARLTPPAAANTQTGVTGPSNTASLSSQHLGGFGMLASLTNLTSLHINTRIDVIAKARQEVREAQLDEQHQLAAALRGMSKLQSLRLEHMPPQPIVDAMQQLTGLTALRIGGAQSKEPPVSTVLPHVELLQVG